MRMNRIEFLKECSRIIKPAHYLEIGVDKCEVLNAVIAPYKLGIDPNVYDRNVFKIDSDEFFDVESELPIFDMIFIDGCHKRDYVIRDICNSINRVSHKDTIIFVHDVCPDERSIDENGTKRGTVYQAWAGLEDGRISHNTCELRFGRNESDYIGVIFLNEKIDDFEIKPLNISWTYYDRDLEEYNNFVTEQEFLEILRRKFNER